MAAKPDPSAFFNGRGVLADELRRRMGLETDAALAGGISRGTYPFKDCRVKVGRYYVYDWQACEKKLMQRRVA